MTPLPGVFRSRPEDFFVEEVVPPRSDQEGEHVHALVEKRGLTTDAAVRSLAGHVGVRPAHVGRLGRKDRRAVTRQWLSFQGIERARLEGLELEGLRVLRTVRMPRKLRLGRFLGNRFRIRVRGVPSDRTSELEGRLAPILERGLPNAFGPQRYGPGGRNVRIGRLLVEGGLGRAAELLSEGPGRAARGAVRRARPSRRDLAFFVAAYQSALFDAVLVARGPSFDAPLPGDVFCKHASGRLLPADRLGGPDELHRRCAARELSPTGPLPGSRTVLASEEAGRLERQVLRDQGLGPGIPAPRWLGLPGTRRPLRVPVTETAWECGTDDGGPFVELRFRLPPGSYATTLLEAVSAGGFREAPA